MLGFKKYSSASGQPVLLISNKKTIVNYVPSVSQAPSQARANIQPFRQKELLLNPIDQRAWSWYRFFIQSPYVNLDVGDNILWIKDYYKVMNTNDWQITNGFVQYDCIKDYQNTPNIAGPNINQPNGLALCDIIDNYYTSIAQPLNNGQIFLYNSNYTPPSKTGFFIIVQLTKIESYGFGGIPREKNTDGSTTQTLTQETKETYSIQIVSSDGSATNEAQNVSLALQQQRDYVAIKSQEVGFNLAEISNAENISDQTGGSIVNRWLIKTSLLSSKSQAIKGSIYYDMVDTSLWLQQG